LASSGCCHALFLNSFNAQVVLISHRMKIAQNLQNG
jgi:hypothetical protein